MATVDVDVRERAEAAAREQQLQMRARAVLGRIGWGAQRPEIEAAIEEDAAVARNERAGVVARAIAAQEDDRRRGRRLTPEEIEGAMAARQVLRPEKIALIRRYVAERRKANPELTGRELCAEVNRVYEAEISEANFYQTYFGPKPSPNGARQNPVARPVVVAPAAAAPTAVPPCSACGVSANELHRPECPKLAAVGIDEASLEPPAPPAEPETNVDTVPPLESATIQPPPAGALEVLPFGVDAEPPARPTPAAAPAAQPETTAATPPAAGVRATRLELHSDAGSLTAKRASDGTWTFRCDLTTDNERLVRALISALFDEINAGRPALVEAA